MTGAEFRSAVSLGLGRAVLGVDGRLHSDALLDACLHSKAYDPQVEGTRTWYTMQLIERSGKRSYFADRILAAVGEDADPWDAIHRFELAARFAEEGDDRARKAMVAAFERAEFDLMQGSFAVEWLNLDGLAGYLYAVEHIGRSLRDGRGNYLDGWLQSAAESTLGEESVRAASRESGNADVSAYAVAVDESRQHTATLDVPDCIGWSYEQIRRAIEAGAPQNGFARWGEHASDAQLAEALADLQRETVPSRQRAYIRLFKKREFPGDCAFLIDLASSEVPFVRGTALSALGNVKDEQVRGFAMRLIEACDDRRCFAVDMLATNFREGDHEYLLDWVEHETEPSMFVGTVSDIRGIFRKHPDEAIERRILGALYERIPCPCCRYEAVKCMLHSPELRAECAWDSYEDTRALVG